MFSFAFILAAQMPVLAEETASATTSVVKENKKLEKTSSPEKIKLFEQIKKIGNDLFGIRKNKVYVLPTLTTDSITCVSAAIDAKDTKISVALTVATAEITSAITTRGICQKAALSVTSERMGAINTCNKTFTNTHKTANDKVKTAQKEAWAVYTASLKTCATNAKVTEIKIEDGGQDVTSSLD